MFRKLILSQKWCQRHVTNQEAEHIGNLNACKKSILLYNLRRVTNINCGKIPFEGNRKLPVHHTNYCKFFGSCANLVF